MANDDSELIDIPKAPKDITQKYVRTFEGDMEILKQGGVPDLAPFAQPTANKEEESNRDADNASTLAQAQITELIPKSFQDADVIVAPRVVATPQIEPTPTPTPTPPLPPPPPAPILPPKPVELPPPPPRALVKDNLETYSNDFAEKIKKENASTATVLAAEQDSSKVDPKKSLQQKSSTDHFYIIAGAVLLLLSIGVAYYAYTRFVATNAPVVTKQTISAPIFVDENENVAGSGTELVQAIVQSAGKQLALNSIRLLSFESSATSSRSVFSELNLHAPDILLRNIQDTGSAAGIINIADSQSPFFILSATSFSETFAGMLSWETSIVKDVSQLYSAHSATAVSTTTATIASTTATTVVAAAKGFKDEVVSNHDVRVYRDAENRSVILYGYWNKSTLVIARDAAAFSEIIQRLANARTR